MLARWAGDIELVLFHRVNDFLFPKLGNGIIRGHIKVLFATDLYTMGASKQTIEYSKLFYPMHLVKGDYGYTRQTYFVWIAHE